jgi:transposase
MEMYKQGYKKAKIVEILGVGRTTVRRWTKTSSHTYLKPHSSEEKQKAIDLVSSGISRKEVSDKLGISYFTIVYWCRGINTWSKHPSYPTILKRKTRMLAKRGIPKGEISLRLNVSYTTVCRWTGDVTNRHSHVNGRYFLALAEIAKKGYMISSRKDVFVFKFLKKYVPVKSLLIGRSAVYYMEGSEMKVFNDIVKRSDLKLNNRKLNLLRDSLKIRGSVHKLW